MMTKVSPFLLEVQLDDHRTSQSTLRNYQFQCWGNYLRLYSIDDTKDRAEQHNQMSCLYAFPSWNVHFHSLGLNGKNMLESQTIGCILAINHVVVCLNLPVHECIVHGTQDHALQLLKPEHLPTSPYVTTSWHCLRSKWRITKSEKWLKLTRNFRINENSLGCHFVKFLALVRYLVGPTFWVLYDEA